ncbi:BRCA1-A complex subunit Abraxas 1 [Anoplopoma fimbria]|uniref:BRCA1-A complex subunit Abraxas 1 n=1 Tax=Anoplopoma fimbria TaxID=229290 RepID=UPI0023ED3B26|nr:BRCA1-A complex subunit Abraxas 1 [Anoplopoma fimbria]
MTLVSCVGSAQVVCGLSRLSDAADATPPEVNMAEPTVRVSGIVLASLMFQHVNRDADVEGLILGESKFEEQITISDSQADHIHIEEIYHIQKHISCLKLNDFYNSVGDVNVDAVKKILADNKQDDVIGWYRQRRNSDQQMTFREKVVHEKLKTSLSNPHMIFVLLTPSRSTPTGSTHKMEYAAFTSRSRQFVNVPVLVNNLGLLEQLAYWKALTPCSAAGYHLAMNKHSSKFFSSNGLLREVNDVNAMNDSLQAELQKASRTLEESERLVETLQADVSALRRKLSEKKKMKSEEGKGGLEDQRDQVLHQAFRALFFTHTLTLEAFPVPDVCRRSHQEVDSVSMTTAPDRTDCRKRPKDTPEGGDRKRRKSQPSE